MQKPEAQLSAFVEAQVYAAPIVSMYAEPALLLNWDHLVLSANPAFYRVFRLSETETAGRFIREIGGEREDLSELRRLIEESAPEQTGDLYFEIAHPGPAGGSRLLRLSTRRVAPVSGNGQVTVLVIEEAAEKPGPPAQPLAGRGVLRPPEAGTAEETRARMLEDVVKSVPEGFMVVSAPEGRLVLASAYHEEASGLPAGEPGAGEGGSFMEEFRRVRGGEFEAAARQTFPAFRSLRAGERVAEEPWQMKTADGTWVDVCVNSAPVRNAKGKITHAVLCWREMSALRKTEAELRRTESQFRTLVENSPDIIVRLDRSLRYLFANTAFEQVTGMSRERLYGRNNRELGMDAAYLAAWEQAARSAIEKGRRASFEFSFPGIFGRRHFQGWIIPEFDGSGQVETLMLIGRDVTERKQAEEHIRYISFHDEVTGLYNRAYFEAEIRRLDTPRSLPISIIIGDVNHLKLTNDTFGHRQGDRLLAAIAGILRQCCRNEDIIARWGGDEFAVILPGTRQETAVSICSRIRKTAEDHPGDLPIRPSIALGTAAKQHAQEDIFQVISAAEEQMYDDKLCQSGRNRKEVIGALLERVRQIWPGHEDHLARTREITRVFARVLGLSQREFEDLNLIIHLHEIGKATVPDEYIRKPGRLTEEEWEAVKRHSEAAFHIVKNFAETARVSDEILSLRERWDGSGYPRGLRGREIPLLSRVFSIVDSYDIMTHERPYAPALTPDQALRELSGKAGQQFDPLLVEKFVQSVAAAGRN